MYEEVMTEESFSNLATETDAIRDFLNKEENSAFYVAIPLIPDDVICKVSQIISWYNSLIIIYLYKCY